MGIENGEVDKLQELYHYYKVEENGGEQFALRQALHPSRLTELQEWTKETVSRLVLIAMTSTPLSARQWVDDNKTEIGLLSRRSNAFKRSINVMAAVNRKLRRKTDL